MFFLFLTLSFVLILAGCGKKADFQVKKGETVLAFGDSLTFGYGASAGKDWPAQFALLSGLNVINSGISGDTTQGGLARIEDDIEQHNPKIVFLGLGGNDFIRRLNPKTTQSNLLQIIEFLNKKNIRVILIAEPAPGLGSVISLSDHAMYKDIASQTDTVLISGLWSKVLSDATLKSDLIHANDKGYAFFAQKLYEQLIDLQILEK